MRSRAPKRTGRVVLNARDLERLRILRAAQAKHLLLNESGRYVIYDLDGTRRPRPDRRVREALMRDGCIEWARSDLVVPITAKGFDEIRRLVAEERAI